MSGYLIYHEKNYNELYVDAFEELNNNKNNT